MLRGAVAHLVLFQKGFPEVQGGPVAGVPLGGNLATLELRCRVGWFPTVGDALWFSGQCPVAVLTYPGVEV